ncbi:hypothetical protein [Succinivibrio faecicola]|uniref:Uncharacterized protein n=1 Tax=Succinivibrio faecicola TaxID=2820300 RepID=A0ABS7DIG8_9GAMM|nr:hypothetical protein [Succinivibrio faecicola]MBW7571104.1 hypothetical protein [Succinivibrio faecicola]
MNTLSYTRLFLNRIPSVVVGDDIGSALVIGVTGKVPGFLQHLSDIKN